jgi:prepilin-type N-terminal cleavage/methylation domain-containing protein
MKIQLGRNRKSKAFTLIEMIGVLAVIAILAALLIPKVFEAINNARINNAAVSYNTVKAAVVDHYAKFGSLLSSNGLPFAVTDPAAMNYDAMLVTEGFLDKRFQVKIGNTNAHVSVTNALAAAATPAAIDAAYDLDGVNGNDAVGGVVVRAIIPGVTENDAKDLNDRLDGPALGVALGDANGDLIGRVKYGPPSSGVTTVHIYVNHR